VGITTDYFLDMITAPEINIFRGSNKFENADLPIKPLVFWVTNLSAVGRAPATERTALSINTLS